MSRTSPGNSFQLTLSPRSASYAKNFASERSRKIWKKQLRRLRGNVKDKNNHKQAEIRLLWGSKTWLCMMLCFDSCVWNARKLLEWKYFPNRKIERWLNNADTFGRLNKIVFNSAIALTGKITNLASKTLFWASDQTRWKNKRFWHEILRIGLIKS